MSVGDLAVSLELPALPTPILIFIVSIIDGILIYSSFDSYVFIADKSVDRGTSSLIIIVDKPMFL
jgi:hypothetical protein